MGTNNRFLTILVINEVTGIAQIPIGVVFMSRITTTVLKTPSPNSMNAGTRNLFVAVKTSFNTSEQQLMATVINAKVDNG